MSVVTVLTVSAPTLQSLKNTLRDLLPPVKSSHMSEAIAYALGFDTNIALVTQLTKSPSGWTAHLNEQRFVERLVSLGYPTVPRLAFDYIIPNAGMPQAVSSLLAQISMHQARSGISSPEVYALRDRCKAAFGAHWRLGRPDPKEDDGNLALRLGMGVGQSARGAGWGKAVRSLGLEMRFPGVDHTERFYQKLPLADGRYVEYCSAMVSMPYLASDNIRQLPKAEVAAQSVGWECVVLPKWTWYVPFSQPASEDATTLVLYRLKERHEDVLRTWETSLKRWAIENLSRIDRAGNPYLDAAVGEVLESPHFPLTVTSFDELQRSYLDEFSHTGYQWQAGVMDRGMEELFALWKASRGQ